jgi:hypothetical protein
VAAARKAAERDIALQRSRAEEEAAALKAAHLAEKQELARAWKAAEEKAVRLKRAARAAIEDL